MKKIIAICALTMLTTSALAQSRVPDGVYTSPVSFNYADSAAKYKELREFYIGSDDLDVYIKFFQKWRIYQAKIDSIDNANQTIKREKQRKALERKYQIILP